MLLGFIVSIGSLGKFSELVGGNPRPFVAQYILGNLLALTSTCLLYGPLSQTQVMLANSRIATTFTYLALAVLTIWMAYLPNPNCILILLFILAQYIALAWYSLSMLPWGQELVMGCFLPVFSNCCSCCCNS